MRALKKCCVIMLAALILVSCSPKKIDTEGSEPLSAEPVSAAVTDDAVYGPKEYYELDALDVDFLDQSVLLPYYENITSEQLEYNFSHSTMCFMVGSVGINAVTPDSALCAHGNFIYDKRTGKISRSCTDPQCRHISYTLYTLSGSCPYTSIGPCRICGDTVYNSTINFGYSSVSTDVVAMDHTFRDIHNADMPEGCVVEGAAEDGRLVLRKELYITYIDENGVQKGSNSQFELYLYDKDKSESELVFAPKGTFSVTRSKSCAYCVMFPENNVYAFTGDFREPVDLGDIKILTVMDGAIRYLDKETGAAYRFDEATGEKTLWASEESPLTRIRYSFYCGDRLYFTRDHTAQEIYAMDFIPEDQKKIIASRLAEVPPSVIYRCSLDGSDIEIAYYVPGYMINGFCVDGEVIYTSGTSSGAFENDGGYFTAYDMSSGVELRVFCPIPEYHYPGEYEYDENWLRGFRWK